MFTKFEEYQNFLSDFYPPDYISILGAWKDCIDSCKIKIFTSEQTVYSPYQYAGTLDAVGRFDEALTVFDWKVAKNIIPAYWLQLEAYRRAHMFLFKEEPVARAIMQIHPETFKWTLYVRPLELNTQITITRNLRKKNRPIERTVDYFPCDHETDWEAFKAAMTIFERNKNK